MLTTSEVARRLDCTKAAVRQMAAAGELKATKSEGAVPSWKFDESDIEAYLSKTADTAVKEQQQQGGTGAEVSDAENSPEAELTEDASDEAASKTTPDHEDGPAPPEDAAVSTETGAESVLAAAGGNDGGDNDNEAQAAVADVAVISAVDDADRVEQINVPQKVTVVYIPSNQRGVCDEVRKRVEHRMAVLGVYAEVFDDNTLSGEDRPSLPGAFAAVLDRICYADAQRLVVVDWSALTAWEQETLEVLCTSLAVTLEKGSWRLKDIKGWSPLLKRRVKFG